MGVRRALWGAAFGRGAPTRDGWPSGLRRTPGKRVYVTSVTRVRIPPHPFALSSVTPLGGALHFRPGTSLVSVVGVRCGRTLVTRGRRPSIFGATRVLGDVFPR